MPPSRLPRPADTSGPRPRRPAPAWLLLVPTLALAWPPLYNRADPHLLGVPFFYAYQLLVIPLAVACAVTVHRAGHRRGRTAVPRRHD